MIGLVVNDAVVEYWTFEDSDEVFCVAKGFALKVGGKGEEEMV